MKVVESGEDVLVYFFKQRRVEKVSKVKILMSKRVVEFI